MSKIKVVALIFFLLVASFGAIIYYKPSIFGQGLMSMIGFSTNFRQMFGMTTSTENFVEDAKDDSSIPQQSTIPSEDNNETDYTQQQNHVNSVFSEIRSYVYDPDVNSNVTYYYKQYCEELGLSPTEKWKGIITVISDDGEYVYGIMNFTYNINNFIVNSNEDVDLTYVVVITYDGFVYIEQTARNFAYQVMAMEEPNDTEIVPQAIGLAETVYSYLIQGSISWYEL